MLERKVRTVNDNVVKLSGIVVKAPELLYKVETKSGEGESIYQFIIQIPREGKGVDEIPVNVSDKQVDVEGIKEDDTTLVTVGGSFRSHNKKDGERTTTELYVLAKSIEYEDIVDGVVPEFVNTISLDGYYCRAPRYRVTKQEKELCESLIACNRKYGKSDYLPCISWGKDASFASNVNVGDRVSISGRVQSRTYIKKFDDGSETKRTTYEVSVGSIGFYEDKKED